MICSSLKVQQLFTTMHTCPSFNPSLQNLLYRWVSNSLVCLQSTCNQFHMYSTLHGGLVRISTLHGGLVGNVPDVCKNSQVFPATVWQTLAQFSIQLLGSFKYHCAACRLFAKYADKQLAGKWGNVWLAGKCQSYPQAIHHSVNDFILLAGKCHSYPQMWSPTVSMIWFCWLGNVRAIHKWSPTVSVVLFWQISISFLKLLFDFIWGECEMCYSPPFLKLLNLVAWGVFIQVFSASMSSWITETKNGKRAKRLGPPLAQMQFWAKRVSSWTLISHQLHRVTSGWITRSKFSYTSSKYKR